MKTVHCDICGNEIKGPELEECLSIDKHRCGYNSVFGDGEILSIDMCQSCFKEKLGEFVRYE